MEIFLAKLSTLILISKLKGELLICKHPISWRASKGTC